MLSRVPVVDVVDSTWVAAAPASVATLVADPANWRRWWPGLDLRVDEWRALKGVRWTVRAVSGHADLAGSAEVWLEPMAEGVVAHFFLRLDPTSGRAISRRVVDKITCAYRRQTKTAFWALADRLDPGRMDRHVSASHTSVG